jgi:hypothetical protein
MGMTLPMTTVYDRNVARNDQPCTSYDSVNILAVIMIRIARSMFEKSRESTSWLFQADDQRGLASPVLRQKQD